jgi:hypothetical protein
MPVEVRLADLGEREVGGGHRSEDDEEEPGQRAEAEGAGERRVGEREPDEDDGGMRTASVGFDRPATRSDFTRRGATPPASFEDEYGFGQPGYDRPPVGYIPPDQRPVRMSRVNERGVHVTSPIPAGEVPAREQEGWTRV